MILRKDNASEYYKLYEPLDPEKKGINNNESNIENIFPNKKIQ